MSGNELKTLTENILDGESMDSDLFITLANLCKARREAERPWMFLLTDNTSNTASSSDTYLSMKTLPSDFATDYKVFVGSSYLEYTPIPFVERHRYRDSFRGYYIDLSASQFALTGKVSETSTIYFIYVKNSADIALSDTPYTGWASRFQPLIAYDVAANFRQSIDYDDQNFAIGQSNRAEAQTLHAAMVQWDAQLKLTDFSVVLFRSDSMLFSEENHMKIHKNQWVWIMP